MSKKIYIGLDVHKNSIAVAYALADGSPPQQHGKWGGSSLAAERGLLKLPKTAWPPPSHERETDPPADAP